MLRGSNQLAIAGIGALVKGITPVVHLTHVSRVLGLPALGWAVAIAGTILWLWYVRAALSELCT